MPKVEEIVKAEHDSEVTRELKRKFALALAKDPAEPWEAARAVWPHNTGNAIYVLQNWPADPEISAYIEAVHDVVGVEGQLPTPEEYALFLWKLAKQALDEDTRFKYLRLYAEARGHLQRPKGDDSGVTLNQNRVMIIAHLGDDEQWADKALTQQRALQQKLSDIADTAVDAEIVDDESSEPKSS